MLSAASIAPAPSPYGSELTISIQKLSESQNPNSPSAVSAVLAAVTAQVPNFLVTLSETRLEIIVPPDIVIEIMPIYDTGTPSSACITGQPEPSSESGRPRLMNARYISAINSVYIV